MSSTTPTVSCRHAFLCLSYEVIYILFYAQPLSTDWYYGLCMTWYGNS